MFHFMAREYFRRCPGPSNIDSVTALFSNGREFDLFAPSKSFLKIQTARRRRRKLRKSRCTRVSRVLRTRRLYIALFAVKYQLVKGIRCPDTRRTTVTSSREKLSPKEQKSILLFVESPRIRQSLVSNYDLFSIPASTEGAAGFRGTVTRSRRSRRLRRKTPGLPPSRPQDRHREVTSR